jgi:phosphoglycolate phosphatase
MKHVLLFDIDGTLIQSGGAGMAALREAMRTAFGVPEPTDAVPVHGRTDRGITRDFLLHHGFDDSEEHWRKFREAYLAHLPGLLATRRGNVLPGVRELLDQLAQREDVAVGLLTGNTQAGAHIKLSHYGLTEYFSFGGYGDEHLDRDDVARMALAQARGHLVSVLDLNRVWVIGDTPADVRCGRAIGARVMAVATGGHSVEDLAASRPDHVAHDLSDPATMLSLLE